MKKLSMAIFSVFFLLLLIFFGSRLAARLKAKKNPYPMFKVFSEVLHLVEQKYVEVPDLSRLHDGALAGLMKAYGHNASFVRADEATLWSGRPWELIQPGLYLYDRGNYFLVTGVIPGTPAEEAGIRQGDRIYEIDDVGAIRINVVQAYRLLSGPPDSSVKLGVYHAKNRVAEFITLKRVDLIPYRFEATYDEKEKAGILRLRGMGDNADKLVSDTLKFWRLKGLERLILDLRNCQDYDYETAFRLVDIFRSDGQTGVFKGQSGELHKGYAFQSTSTLYQGPLAVIVDLSVAGACEAVAGLLKDLESTIVMGQETPGEVFWYDQIRVNQDFYIWMPVARMIEKDGSVFASEGIKPEVEYTNKKDKEHPFIIGDDVLKEALEILRNNAKKVA